MAVGSRTNSSTDFETLAESWDGTRWSVVPSPSRGTNESTLLGVSCVSAAACTAVGLNIASSGTFKTLVESWDGTSWSVVPSPSPGIIGNSLSAVSCVSAAACMATGDYSNGSISKTLTQSWNGTKWSVVPSPSPGSQVNLLNGVSCVSATACTAAGYHMNGSGTLAKTLIESWNGTGWSVVPSPSPGPVGNFLNAVSCVSAAACTATGYRNRNQLKTLIESGTASG